FTSNRLLKDSPRAVPPCPAESRPRIPLLTVPRAALFPRSPASGDAPGGGRDTAQADVGEPCRRLGRRDRQPHRAAGWAGHAAPGVLRRGGAGPVDLVGGELEALPEPVRAAADERGGGEQDLLAGPALEP